MSTDDTLVAFSSEEPEKRSEGPVITPSVTYYGDQLERVEIPILPQGAPRGNEPSALEKNLPIILMGVFLGFFLKSFFKRGT